MYFPVFGHDVRSTGAIDRTRRLARARDTRNIYVKITTYPTSVVYFSPSSGRQHRTRTAPVVCICYDGFVRDRGDIRPRGCLRLALSSSYTPTRTPVALDWPSKLLPLHTRGLAARNRCHARLLPYTPGKDHSPTIQSDSFDAYQPTLFYYIYFFFLQYGEDSKRTGARRSEPRHYQLCRFIH